jgi:DtxR family transcriptional regulator, Mn-dependent transcriptional regulator
MDPSAREDYLEAVLIATLALQRMPSAEDVASQLKSPGGLAKINPADLVNNGDISIHPDGGMELTEKGKVIAERVLKKHRVLQCFFREMLGMDDRLASDEACVLEHDVSDHTIQRLGNYIEGSGDISYLCPEIPPELHSRHRIRLGKGRGKFLPILKGSRGAGSPGSPADKGQGPGGPGEKGTWSLHTLLDMDESTLLVVAGISQGSDIHRLIDLGIIPGEEILLRRKLKNQAVVIRVKGCDIALSPEIAGTILVEKKG